LRQAVYRTRSKIPKKEKTKMADEKPHDTKEDLDKELEDEDTLAGDDQTSNPKRDKFTTLHGEE
jgi:hypothetical protein